MASVVNDPNGRKLILFIGADGRRRAVRLGKASRKQETLSGCGWSDLRQQPSSAIRLTTK